MRHILDFIESLDKEGAGSDLYVASEEYQAQGEQDLVSQCALEPRKKPRQRSQSHGN